MSLTKGLEGVWNFCWNCGVELAEAANYCHKCGKEMNLNLLHVVRLYPHRLHQFLLEVHNTPAFCALCGEKIAEEAVL